MVDRWIRRVSGLSFACVLALPARAQLTDVIQAPNAANEGIKKSLLEQIGVGRGDVMTPGSSAFLINRDPFRAIARGRQLFQRKFTAAQGVGPRTGDGMGAIDLDGSIGAGLADSCGACHARPFGSAGFGGNVFTRPKSRDAPHLFGLGLQEMLADEITQDLRAIEAQAVTDAMANNATVTLVLTSKGVHYGSITALSDGSVDTSLVEGVNADLRVRPFFAEGSTVSIREFLVGAFNAEMGVESHDPDLLAAAGGSDVVTPSGMSLPGSLDAIEAPPALDAFDDPDLDGVVHEMPESLVDFMEFYLLNYFKPGRERVTAPVMQGQNLFDQIGCTACHIQNLTIDSDRRVADVETNSNGGNSNKVFNNLFSVATPLLTEVDDGSGFPTLKVPSLQPFVVRNIYTDLKRHDLGQQFHETNFDGSVTTHFMTEPLWGVGSTPPYGHDGRSHRLEDVILRHGGEALAARQGFEALTRNKKRKLLDFLNGLVLFSPPDTASNLDTADRAHPMFPLVAQGSIDLSQLFNDTSDKE